MHADRYLALVDILGFKSMVLAEPLEAVVEKVQRLLHSTDSRIYNIYSPGSKRESRLEIGRYHFSDTLLLWSPPVDEKNPEQEKRSSNCLYAFLSQLLQEAIFNKIPLRGAVSYGPTWIDADRGIVVGTPVIDAYALEQDQTWIGVAVHDNCLARPKHEEMGLFVADYRPPIKANRPDVSKAVIDWTTPLKVNQENHLKARGFSAQERFDELIEFGLQQTEDVRLKYLNTQDFVRTMRKTRPVYDSFAFIPKRGDA